MVHNNIDTSSSDEKGLGVVAIATSISCRYSNIVVVASGLLPKDIHLFT